jgi:hypothetical protein
MEGVLLTLFSLSVLGIALLVATRNRQHRVAFETAASDTALGAMPAPRAGPASRRFLIGLFAGAFVVRLATVVVIAATDAIRAFQLSPDSLRYHEEGIGIAQQMDRGDFNWPNWIDNGWFQFTGFVYHHLGANPVFIQLINITLGALTPIVVFHLVLRVYRSERLARVVAILTAFFPSFVYWSSLMLKDPLAIFSVTLLAWSVVRLRDGVSVRAVVAMAGALLMLLAVREYLFFVALFLVMLSYFPVEGRGSVPTLAGMVATALALGIATQMAGYGFLGADFVSQSHYFDLDYINQSRVNIGHGSGAFFDDPEAALWGGDFGSSVKAALAAVYFFFVSIDFTSIGSVRQMFALPEVIVILLLLPYFVRGLRGGWRNARQQTLPMAVFVFGLLAVYGSAATNMGAMFRWRMQAMPFLLAIMAYGVALRGRGAAFNLLRRLGLQ